LADAGQVKPSLVVRSYGLVEQRALGVTRVVELGFGGGWIEYCKNKQFFANFSSDFSSAGLHIKLGPTGPKAGLDAASVSAAAALPPTLSLSGQ
jgi:hypothetical protein